MDDRFRIDEEEPPKSQVGLWIVAGVLTLLLVGYHSMGGETDEKQQPRNVVVASQINMPKPVATVSQRQPIQWPSIAFDDLVKNNPFYPGHALQQTILGTDEDQAAVQHVKGALENSREEKRERREAMAEKLAKSEWSIRFLFKTQKGTAALIGDNVVYEGDKLGNYQVIAIEDDGIVVQPLDTSEVPSEPSN